MRRPRAASPFAALREFAEWWVDVGQQTPCCQFATEDEIGQDPDQYRCDTCLVVQAFDGLDEDNRKAWTLFRQVCTRFLFETHSTGVALARLTADLDEDTMADTLTRLSILYDLHYPPKRGHNGA